MPDRARGRTTKNEPFDEATVEAVWKKGIVVRGVDPALRRKDTCGAWMSREQHGVTVERGAGWEIDHVVPVSRGGSDALGNLQPLQWENNRAKGDKPVGQWRCARREQN